MLDHDAIYKAYPNVVTISDDVGALDKDRNKVALEKSKIDAARSEIDADYAKVKYKDDRVGGLFPDEADNSYPSFGDQLDLLYKGIDADSDLKTKFAAFHAAIKTVKDAHPKP